MIKTWFSEARSRVSMTIKPASEHYLVSVVDSDGDHVLVDAPLQAADYSSAWNQALAIALRTCQGSGAMPMTLSVVRVARAITLS
jgi:hypothetical protein